MRQAGGSTPELGIGQKHWWENLTDQTVILIFTNVVPVELLDTPMIEMP